MKAFIVDTYKKDDIRIGEMPDPVIDVCILRRATAATRRADRD
jgi:hypothetical protein